MRKHRFIFLVLFSFLAVNFQARGEQGQVAVAEKVKSALVQVEYDLQFDRGESPRGGGWMERCPTCGDHHVQMFPEFIREERPLAVGGFLISPTEVLTEDLQTHPRFIKGVSVRFRDEVRKARPGRYLAEENGVILELEEPFSAAEALEFDSEFEGPYYSVNYLFLNGHWTVEIDPVGRRLVLQEPAPPFTPAGVNSLIVNGEGRGVGVTMNGELPLDGSWKKNPSQWRGLGAGEMEDKLAAVEEKSSQGLLHVSLHFRSPQTQPGQARFQQDRTDPGQETLRHVAGVLIGPGRLLVLADLNPKTTARLEHIFVNLPGGEIIPARFVYSLRNHAALVADLEEELPNPLKLSGEEIRRFRNQLLLGAEINFHGESRAEFFVHCRIASFREGWKGRLEPQVPTAEGNLFVFDLEEKLVAIPLARRERASGAGYSHQRSAAPLVPVAELAEVLENLEEHVDLANIPLSAEEENRLAWMGVELQALSRELARVNQVSDQTRDGQTGALVTFVYPNSPAEEAGIEPGFILLRLHVPGEPAPIEVTLEEDRMYQQAFPWDRLDEVPDQFLDQIPSPWPPAENSLSRLLTDFGVGTEYEAEFFNNGEVLVRSFVILPGPDHYASAPRHRAANLGLTVRDLTYEVRRYLQRGEDEPGVVISRVDPGGRASVAGIKPYEVITHINNQPVSNAREFEELILNQEELHLSVRRMTSGRLVTIRTGTPILEDAGETVGR